MEDVIHMPESLLCHAFQLVWDKKYCHHIKEGEVFDFTF